MKYVDTNALIQIITEDNVEQSSQATEAISTGQWFINAAVLTEVCFILQYHEPYRLSHRPIGLALVSILMSQNIHTEEHVLDALVLYGDKPQLDFVDCLLAVQAGYKKADVLTFDKDLIKALR